MSRSALAGALAAVLLAPVAVLPVAVSAAPAPAQAAGTRTATLVGSLQDELGCAADWDPACEATQLSPVEGSATAYTATFEVPAGSWAFKVALDGAWDEAHP